MILSVIGLYKSFYLGFRGRKTTIVHDIHITIQPGEIYALLGPNGSGKTTTLECIMGLHTIDQGQIYFFDNKKLDNTIRKRIGYAADQVSYFDHLTGWENLMLFADYIGVDKYTKQKVGQSLFDELDLSNVRDRLVSSYSQGMKQRLGLIISLIHNPDLLIWDEPMNGLDPLGRIAIKKLMQRLQSQGKTIIFSTHILSDVEETADRFGIIHHGKKIYEGTVEDIKEDLENFFATIIQKESTAR